MRVCVCVCVCVRVRACMCVCACVHVTNTVTLFGVQIPDVEAPPSRHYIPDQPKLDLAENAVEGRAEKAPLSDEYRARAHGECVCVGGGSVLGNTVTNCNTYFITMTTLYNELAMWVSLCLAELLYTLQTHTILPNNQLVC